MPVSFNDKTCAQCHSLESGSDSSHMTEGFFLRAPRAMPIEMAHLRQMLLRTPSTAEASAWAALLAQMPDRATVGAIIRGCFASGEFQAIETAPWIYE